MPTSTWKQHERRTAKALQGRRLGATGTSTPDVVSDWLVIECKHRKTVPKWLTDAVSRIRQQAGPFQLGVVVLHEAGRHDSVVCLSLADFKAWFGDVHADTGDGG